MPTSCLLANLLTWFCCCYCCCIILLDVFFIVFMPWFRSWQTSPLGCQWKPCISLGVLPCLVLREDKQSSVQEPNCNTHLQPASEAWPDISGSLTCTRRDQPFVPTWTLLSSGRHGRPRGHATPGGDPGRAQESNRIRRGLAWPRGTMGTGSRKVGTGSASDD